MAEQILLLAIREHLHQELTDFLKNEGYNVHNVDTVSEVYVWLAANGKPHRIICDGYGLRISDKTYNEDGYRFLIELSRDSRYNDIKFGLIGNGYDDHPFGWGLAKPELPAQLCFWLPSPFDGAEFLAALRACDGDASYLGQAPQKEWNSGSPRLKAWARKEWSLYDEDQSD